MGKHQHDDEIEIVVNLEDLIEWEEELKPDSQVVPPPPPRGEFEGWEDGEEDLT